MRVVSSMRKPLAGSASVAVWTPTPMGVAQTPADAVTGLVVMPNGPRAWNIS